MSEMSDKHPQLSDECLRSHSVSPSLNDRRSLRSNKSLTPNPSSASRVRSASAGRSKDDDLKCRYWAFLFDNLHRAVDEIYQNCERDESIVECKETIMILDNYTREFQALIQWINLTQDFESTPPPQRPMSLAWSVRKTLPMKQMIFWNTFSSKHQKLEHRHLENDEKENIKVMDINDKNENINHKMETNDAIIKEKVLTKECNENDDVNKSQKSVSKVIKQKSIPQSMSVNRVITSSNQRSAASIVANGKRLNRSIASNPDLSVNPQQSQSVTRKRTDPKVIPVICKNFIKETNASRAKNVRNASDGQLTRSRSQNVLLLRNGSSLSSSSSSKNLSSRENIQTNTGKSKKIKDADGWELVRGRQRFKNSPPKVIIFDDNDQMIKTTADGTVIAVTASSQTMNNWPDWDQLDPRMCATWPQPNHGVDTDLMRTPGRALEMHEKLSSPSRKRSLSESIKRHEEKLAKAQEAREKYLQKKAQKFKGIVKKVEDIKVKKEEQQMQLKITMEMKLQRAEEKRQQQLKRIVRKAHDEESKVIEIQFINSLEAQNKRHDIMSKEKDHEARLADLHEERQRRLEEKAAKEAAAEERRKALEEERIMRLMELCERRKQKETKIEQHLQEKEKERMDLIREKMMQRQERISAINAQHQANVEELQKKIIMKQEESKRRHEENMEQIRQKALELSVKRSSAVGNDEAPKCVPYDTKKLCSLCSVIIASEVYLFGHLRGKRHQNAIKEKIGGRIPTAEELEQFNLKHIIEAPNGGECDASHNGSSDSVSNECDSERLKAIKKRCKKLKQKLMLKGTQFESEWNQRPKNGTFASKPSQRMTKLMKDLVTLSGDTQITGPWPTNMVHSTERIINELDKILKNRDEQMAFNVPIISGVASLCKLLSRVLSGTKERPTSLPDRVNAKLCSVIFSACHQCTENSHYLVQSNCVMTLLETLSHRCNLLDTSLMTASSTSTSMNADPVIGSLCRLIAGIFDSLHCDDDQLLSRVHDIISFTVSVGLVDKLSCLMSNIRGPIEDTPELALLLESIIQWLTSMTKLVMFFDANNDPTQLMMTLKLTQMAGVVSLVYGVLLHSGAPQRSDENGDVLNCVSLLPKHTLSVVHAAIKLCNYVSLIDLNMVQMILGSEGLSLQLRHICSYLLWYCSLVKCSDIKMLLHEVILLIGTFVVLNPENQSVIQSGQRPTVLQQLCSLPFEYFSDDQLSRILFPTLIASCYLNTDNRVILEQEMSTLMLVTFIESTIVDLQLKAANVSIQKDNRIPSKVEERWTLSKRFPKNKWNHAKDFFDSQH